jgi:hypothetical protein
VKYGLVVLVGVIAGCFPQPPHEKIIVPAPHSLQPRPLEVGQWATYIEREDGREVGRLYLRAIESAGCGMWVRARVTNGDDWRTWSLCVGHDGTLTRAMLVDGDLHTLDVANLGEHRVEVEALLSRIVPRVGAGLYMREDLVVDAGSFLQTLRVRYDGATTWLHPSVPFGGAVQITDGHGREDVLYETGNTGDDYPRDLERATARSRHEGTYELGAAFGWFSGTNRRPSEGTAGFMLNATLPTSRHFDLLLHASSLDGSELHNGWVGLGARWSPLRRDRGFATNQVFVQATADYVQLDDDHNTLGRGGGLSIGAGYSFPSRHDWALTFNVDQHLAYLNAGHGFTQSFSAGFAIQLAFP